MTKLHEELQELFEEIWNESDNLPGNVERIKDCTLTEQFRHEYGFRFDDSDNDRQIVEVWEDSFTDHPDIRIDKQVLEATKLMEIKGLPLLVKYPTVAEYVRKDAEKK